ncbi:hypothetical protein CANCADRAFT_56708 [Tortispora caseinolytica NRRL Y-17796]|uniref:Myosin motor domain-containing protein n=1 Tax=Tortispora caseinolytica NRRL Y-17796 TaxID=767744 RepID=A0A1E4TEE4_9ASCO|nr:hypothetical protein CANCADRAFT_56708 [Tortispora caseinolytica NRRL Y-17796]
MADLDDQVWVSIDENQFIQGKVTSIKGTDCSVACDDVKDIQKANPPQFEKVSDMAKLTHLNEPSVLHNLKSRYQDDSIYTYSGLFLVAVNPYKSLPLYTQDIVDSYIQESIKEPHLFAVANIAYDNLIRNNKDQSILVTGESGAGKTESTKKIIQFLTAKASSNLRSLDQQILQANPLLESFGNAQTVRNDNSSRFGKFIRIEVDKAGHICGATIDWYLLEKSRIVTQNPNERNYHIFYQLLAGAPAELLSKIKLGRDPNQYNYLKNCNKSISGISDSDEFQKLVAAMSIVGFSIEEQTNIFTVLSIILHIGNIAFSEDRSGQARISNPESVRQLCTLMSVSYSKFSESLISPKVKAGREFVTQKRSASQAKFTADSVAKALYERLFATLVKRINQTLQRQGDVHHFIGVLDIAGFEIFEHNSFEQLCINYTNEKLQQFFNHHMFVLEQEEYSREQIDWNFVDYALDLQKTIGVIEGTKPIGLLSCLDEDSVMPAATDRSFTDKINSIWGSDSDEQDNAVFQPLKLKQGFQLSHYAGKVEYSTEGWLEKNKDPMTEALCELFSGSEFTFLAELFREGLLGNQTKGKRGQFRTVSQRHREQLSALMSILEATEPYFIRCIIPNNEHRAGMIDNALVLKQLRCNGVLEGIRISRSGFPNRIFYHDFQSRYKILSKKSLKGLSSKEEKSSVETNTNQRSEIFGNYV